MRSRLNTPELERFLALAEDYCRFLEGADQGSLAELLAGVERRLPLVYHAAVCLPIGAWKTSEHPDVSVPEEDVSRVQAAAARLLGKWDYYNEVFNPAERSDDKPVGSLLSLDLAEIYQDLREAMALADVDTLGPGDILWQWQFDFTHHWGRHAVSALRMVNALLRMEFVAVLDEAGEAHR